MLCFLLSLWIVNPLDAKFSPAERLHPTESFLLICPHSLRPSLKVNGVVWLGKIALFRICVEYEGDWDTHKQTCTHRLVLLAILTYSGKASLFQFYNEEMGIFEAVPPIHQRRHWNTHIHTQIWHPFSIMISHSERNAASILALTLWK